MGEIFWAVDDHVKTKQNGIHFPCTLCGYWTLWRFRTVLSTISWQLNEQLPNILWSLSWRLASFTMFFSERIFFVASFQTIRCCFPAHTSKAILSIPAVTHRLPQSDICYVPLLCPKPSCGISTFSFHWYAAFWGFISKSNRMSLHRTNRGSSQSHPTKLSHAELNAKLH